MLPARVGLCARRYNTDPDPCNLSLPITPSGPPIFTLGSIGLYSGTDADSRAYEMPMLLLRVMTAVLHALAFKKAELVVDRLALGARVIRAERVLSKDTPGPAPPGKVTPSGSWTSDVSLIILF